MSDWREMRVRWASLILATVALALMLMSVIPVFKSIIPFLLSLKALAYLLFSIGAIPLLLMGYGRFRQSLARRFTFTFRRFIIRLAVAFVGGGAILLGLELLWSALWPVSSFVGTFVCVTGVQIVLWAIHIRLEIIGNVTPELR
jgi:hypothetical protein